jgi:hypothetical protein
MNNRSSVKQIIVFSIQFGDLTVIGFTKIYLYVLAVVVVGVCAITTLLFLKISHYSYIYS